MRADAADTQQFDDRANEKSSVYDAFISYDHDDLPVARGIQRGLHRIGKRLGQLHALRVFRDSTDLSASPDLWGKVAEAMDNSRYMVVVLSPNAVVSEWVDKEVTYWLANRGPDHLLFVMAGGSLTWDSEAERFDPDGSDSALPVLTQPGVLPTEPLYVDVSDDAPWDPGSALFREKVTDLAAPIHGKPKYELASEDLREQRKFRRLRRYAIAALALLTVVAVVAAVIAVDQRREAERQRDAADTRFREATAARLSIESQAMLTGARGRDDVRAIQEALASQRVAGTEDPGALVRAVGATSETLKIIRVAAPMIGGLTVQIDPTRGLDMVTSVAASPDGSRIVTGGRKGRIWSADSGQPVSKAFGIMVMSVAFSPDGRRVASGGADNTIGLWDAESGSSLGNPLTGHTAVVTAVAFSPDGHRLVSGSADGTVRLWNTDSSEALGVLTSDSSDVSSVVFSPDGHRVASASKDGTVRVVDVETRATLKTWATGAEVTSVAFGPNNRVVSGDTGGDIRVYDAGTGEQFDPLPTGYPDTFDGVGLSAALSPDGRLVAFGGFDQNIQVWDIDARSPVRPPLVGHTGWITSVAFAKDSQLVSGSYDGTVRIWDAQDRGWVGKEVLAGGWQGRPPPVPRSVALAPDSHRMVAGFRDGMVSMFDTDTGRQVGPVMAGHVGRVTVAEFSPDGGRIATGGDDGTVRFWDGANGTAIRVPTERSAPIVDLKFSPDGRRVVAQIEGGTALLWDPQTGQMVGQPLTGHRGEIEAMAFSPDSRRLATGGDDMTVRLWDSDNGVPVGDPLTGHEQHIHHVAFGDNGHTVISLSAYSLRLWDADTRKPIGKPHFPDPNIFSGLAVSPDGRIVVTSGFGTVQRWDAATGAPIGGPMAGHTDLVMLIGVSGDGRYIVSGDDKTLRFWDAETGEPVGEPLLTPDVKMSKLLMSRDDRRMLIWAITPAEHVNVWLWPGPASWRDDLCSKLSSNMSAKQWDEWISPAIDDVKLCPDLPDLPADAG